MTAPNRTHLLRLQDRRATVGRSLTVLKARRQALILEFLASSRLYLRSRREVRALLRRAGDKVHLAMGHEGEAVVDSTAAASRRATPLGITAGNILGVGYHDIAVPESIGGGPDDRAFDVRQMSPRLEEAVDLGERLAREMLVIASYENRLKRLGEAILQVSRRARVLEERLLPGLTADIRATKQHIGEREREEYYRLKRFKSAGHTGTSP